MQVRNQIEGRKRKVKNYKEKNMVKFAGILNGPGIRSNIAHDAETKV